MTVAETRLRRRSRWPLWCALGTLAMMPIGLWITRQRAMPSGAADSAQTRSASLHDAEVLAAEEGRMQDA